MKKFPLYIIGAGAGEADLISVKGARILGQSEVVVYDYLVDKSVLNYAPPEAEKICADELDDKRYSDGFSFRVKLITDLLVKKVRQGKKVVRLKNGDPTIFSRLNEELEILRKNQVAFRIIPGISAFQTAAAISGIPLTARDVSSSICITTGHEANQKKHSLVDWKKVAQNDTIVLYMAVENLLAISRQLIAAGKKESLPVAVISRVGSIYQKMITGSLTDIARLAQREKLTAPAVVIVGEVVEKEKKFNWFKKARKILYTGLSGERFFTDGLIFHLPLIEIKPLSDYSELNEVIEKIVRTGDKSFDWIVFTSRFGVKYFFEQMFKKVRDVRALSGIKIAAIGQSTAAKLRDFGILADLVPSEESSFGLLREFEKIAPDNRKNPQPKILLPRSDIADKGLTDGLRKIGFAVYPVVVYKNVLPENLPDLDLNFFDEIIFSSPSTIKNFIKRYGRPPSGIKITTIGPVTKNAWQEVLKK